MPTSTPTVDQLWSAQLAQLDLVWGRDWQRTIQILTDFASAHPNFMPAKDKLYAAHVVYADALFTGGETDAAIAQLEAADLLLPDRPEANGTLVALTPTPTDVPTRRPVPVNLATLPPSSQVAPTPLPPAPAQTPTARPLVPGGPATG